ncbi:MAG: 3-phosphoshikimate 1-carboxyvinyltransferase [Candidatus Muirbacterium halophilum]|nr:3-phosphoshikimate 1-carboxyvinyltransferase [Candidatus Muirbacterium halophilum]MCK9474851.1 3-phosphoshikimate 1-carboxyvinyltransferase [Candidatus Muirbacterium halophilum]
MIFEVKKYPNNINTQITIPPDKSISHRAVLLNIIANGNKAKIENFLFSDDTMASINFARSIGIVVECDKDKKIVYIIKNNLQNANKEIDCLNSGTTARLCISILAGLGLRGVVTGDYSLLKRPMNRITGFLKDMNCNIYDNNGKLPVFISKSSLNKIDMESEIGSAQQKTAWIIANLLGKGNNSCYKSKRKSRDHTEIMLKAMNCELIVESSQHYNEIIKITDNSGIPKMKDFTIPSDFSSAAFFIVFALICKDCNLTLKSININPTRAYLLDILKKMNGNITILNEKQIDGEIVADIIVKTSILNGIKINEKEKIPFFIDEIPILSIAMFFASGNSEIHGVEELRFKECDRINKIIELGAFFGVEVYEKNNTIYLTKNIIEKTDFINAENDHRIIMTAVILCILTQRKLKLDSISGINVSFPSFLKKFMEFGYEFKYSN